MTLPVSHLDAPQLTCRLIVQPHIVKFSGSGFWQICVFGEHFVQKSKPLLAPTKPRWKWLASCLWRSEENKELTWNKSQLGNWEVAVWRVPGSWQVKGQQSWQKPMTPLRPQARDLFSDYSEPLNVALHHKPAFIVESLIIRSPPTPPADWRWGMRGVFLIKKQKVYVQLGFN